MLALLISLAGARCAPAAVINIINTNAAGVGFNDPTAVAPVGGNAGTTLGAQRLIVFERAANIWAGVVLSNVAIRVDAQFTDLPCNASSGTLGEAGPTEVFRDFTGELLPGTWYPKALADALADTDLDPATADISADFNSAIGTTCPLPLSWYYGLDGNATGQQSDLLTVVLHELGHGLGFLTFIDLSTGAKLNGFDDTFMLDLVNHNTGMLFPVMTDAQRLAASTAGPALRWVGSTVVASSGFLTGGRDPVSGQVQMYAPAQLQVGSSVSHFDTALTPDELMEPVYTGPDHDVSFTTDLFRDIGWSTLASTVSCASPVAVNQPKLVIGKLKTPPGDDTVTFQGAATLPFPFAPALNPLANGVQLAVDDALGPVVVATVPGGAFVKGGSGWKVNKKGTTWSYANNAPASADGIFKIVIKDQSSKSAGLVSFMAKGKRGSYAVAPASLPLQAQLTLSAAQCGAADFSGPAPAPTCAFNASGSKLTCK